METPQSMDNKNKSLNNFPEPTYSYTDSDVDEELKCSICLYPYVFNQKFLFLTLTFKIFITCCFEMLRAYFM